MSDLLPARRAETRVSRATNRQLNAIRQQALVEKEHIDLEEASAAYVADRRIDNGYLIAGRTAQRATVLSAQITQAARAKEGLEMNLRVTLEEPVLLASSILITRYMNR
jgi:hypothetical protein